MWKMFHIFPKGLDNVALISWDEALLAINYSMTGEARSKKMFSIGTSKYQPNHILNDLNITLPLLCEQILNKKLSHLRLNLYILLG